MRPALVALAVAACGCTARQESPLPDSAVGHSAAHMPDSLVGTVAIVGSEPATMVSLRPRDGAPAVILGGPVLAALRAAAGTEVWASGTRTDARNMDVSRFEVRSVHGIPALDGVVARDGDTVVLVTADGRRVAVPRLPAELRSQMGARVWVAGPLDRDPELFGIIARDSAG